MTMIEIMTYNLDYIPLQLEFRNDPWKMLICCICLNLTHRDQVRSIIYKFFQKYPTPQSVIDCQLEELTNLIQPLGLSTKRALTIQRFSKEFIKWDGLNVKSLYGIGQYGSDSWEIFQKNNYELYPTDVVLSQYLKEVKKLDFK